MPKVTEEVLAVREYRTDETITTPFAVRTRPHASGLGYQAQLLLPDGQAVLTAEGIYRQDAIAALFSNLTNATLYALKKAAMLGQPALKVADGAHHKKHRDGQTRRWRAPRYSAVPDSGTLANVLSQEEEEVLA